MEKPPIKSQKEADEVFNNVVKIAVNTLKISKKQAEKRTRALLDSGILKGRKPHNIKTKMLIDKFMLIPR